MTGEHAHRWSYDCAMDWYACAGCEEHFTRDQYRSLTAQPWFADLPPDMVADLYEVWQVRQFVKALGI